MLIKPAEREWLWEQRHFAYGALSVFVPFAVVFGLMIGFAVN